MEMSICRGCLTTDRKMTKAIRYEAEFKDLTGISISLSDGLPQWLCYECVALLQKCVRFGNKVTQSHIMLCQYVLKSVPFPCDKDGDPHLSQTVILHCDIPSAQTEQLEDAIEKTIEDDNNMADITNLENIQVKKEPLFCNTENNIEEEKSWEQYRIADKDDENKSWNISEFDTKNIRLVMSNHDELSEQGEVETRIREVLNDIDVEIAIVKHESLSSDHEDDTLEDWCIVQQNELSSKTSKLMPNDEEQTEQEKVTHGLLRTGTRAARPLLQARAQLDERTETPATPCTENGADSKNNVNNNRSVNDKSPNNTRSYICDECNKCFKNKKLLIAHIREHTKEKPYKCDICMKSYCSKQGLISHNQVHHGSNKTYKCDICKKCFTQKMILATHYRIHTGEKPYKCDVCMQCFNDRSVLIRHSVIHTDEKPYKCDVCMKDFRRPSHLRAHVNCVHIGDKPYKCDVCTKTFHQKIHLRMHLRIHENDKPYKCDVCFTCFYDKNTFNKHKSLHKGEKAYKMKCDICMKGFNGNSNFLRHMRTHTGEKPFKCEVCMKSFVDKGSCTKHVRIHTGEKPFICDICKKGFNQKSHLSSHYLTHSGYT